MNNEVKGKIGKLQTTVRWDEEEGELVTILKIWTTGITPAQLHTLFGFQCAGPLEEKAPAHAPDLPPVGGEGKGAEYSTTKE